MTWKPHSARSLGPKEGLGSAGHEHALLRQRDLVHGLDFVHLASFSGLSWGASRRGVSWLAGYPGPGPRVLSGLVSFPGKFLVWAGRLSWVWPGMPGQIVFHGSCKLTA